MLTQLDLVQFRNHTKLSIKITSPLLTITGLNGSGKTNILEAVYVSSFTKSFRSKDINLIQAGTDFCTIDRFDDLTKTHLRFINSPNSRKKQVKINNSPKPLKDIIGQNPITLFEPNDLGLLIGLPNVRRDYLDKILSQVDREYLRNLQMYKKLLSHRNSLLRRAKKEPVQNLPEQIFTLNIQLIKPAFYITQQRLILTQELIQPIEEYFQKISRQNQEISITFNQSSQSSDNLLQKLEDSFTLDSTTGFTTVGPHREDFIISLDNQFLEDRASRGELRSLVLALKLAELDYIEKILHKRPILLLDDVLSELDEKRQQYLLQNLQKQQTILTATHLPQKISVDFQHVSLPL